MQTQLPAYPDETLSAPQIEPVEPSAVSFLDEHSGISESGAGSVEQIMNQVREAQCRWRMESVRRRSRLIRRWRKLILGRLEEFARQVADERGCDEAEALMSEILPFLESLKFIEKYAVKILRPQKLGWRGRPLWLSLCHSEIHRDPIGIILILAPSNYPLMLAGAQAAQALVAGNGVLFKPAEGHRGCSELLQKTALEAGFPQGIFELLDESVGSAKAALAANPDHVILTGGHETGQLVAQELAKGHTFSTTFELSGCDAMYVRNDADMSLAVKALIFGLTLNHGRTCLAPKRIFVQEAALQSFEAWLAEEFKKIPESVFQPLTSLRHKDWINDAVHAGAKILLCGSHDGSEILQSPVILTNGSPNMELAKRDVFAPVATLIPVSSDSAFLEAQSVCPYALGTSIFTRDISVANSLARSLNVGTVNINDLIAPTADPRLPFGGCAHSGHGVTRGREGLLALTHPKVITRTRSKLRPHYDKIPEKQTSILYRVVRALHGQWLSRKK